MGVHLLLLPTAAPDMAAHEKKGALHRLVSIVGYRCTPSGLRQDRGTREQFPPVRWAPLSPSPLSLSLWQKLELVEMAMACTQIKAQDRAEVACRA